MPRTAFPKTNPTFPISADNAKAFMYAFFSNEAHIVLNKRIANTLGINAAIILADLISKQKYFDQKNKLDEDGFFFNSQNNIQEDTCLTAFQQRDAISVLEQNDLISRKRDDMHQTWCYKINDLAVIGFFTRTNEIAHEETSPGRMRKLDTNKNKLNDLVSKETNSDEQKPVRRDDLVEYWNGLPNVRQHKDPSSQVYRNAKFAFKALKAGTFHERYIVDNSWLVQRGIPERYLTRAWTDTMIKGGLVNISNMLTQGYNPIDKSWIPKDLPTLIYNTQSQKSIFLDVVRTAPKQLHEERTIKARQNESAGTVELVNVLADALNFCRKTTRLSPGDNKILTDLVYELSEDKDTPVDELIKDYAKYIKKRYETFSQLAAHMLKPQTKVWLGFITERNKG